MFTCNLAIDPAVHQRNRTASHFTFTDSNYTKPIIRFARLSVHFVDASHWVFSCIWIWSEAIELNQFFCSFRWCFWNWYKKICRNEFNVGGKLFTCNLYCSCATVNLNRLIVHNIVTESCDFFLRPAFFTKQLNFMLVQMAWVKCLWNGKKMFTHIRWFGGSKLQLVFLIQPFFFTLLSFVIEQTTFFSTHTSHKNSCSLRVI